MFQFSPDRVEYNRGGPSWGHKIYFFRVWSGSGQDITEYYGVGVKKPCPAGTLVGLRSVHVELSLCGVGTFCDPTFLAGLVHFVTPLVTFLTRVTKCTNPFLRTVPIILIVIRIHGYRY